MNRTTYRMTIVPFRISVSMYAIWILKREKVTVRASERQKERQKQTETETKRD